MTKQELLDLLNVYSAESVSEWGAAIAYEAANGPLSTLTRNAENSAVGFRVAIEQLEKEIADIPAAEYNLGGAAHLEAQRDDRLTVTHPTAAAYAALLTYASETHLDPDVGAGTGAVDVAGAGEPVTGPDVAAGEGTVV